MSSKPGCKKVNKGRVSRKVERVSRKSRKSKPAYRPKSKSRKSKPTPGVFKNVYKDLPKTMVAPAPRSKSVNRVKQSHASEKMSITELQFMAKSRGIPFGGLNKTKLIMKINNYY